MFKGKSEIFILRKWINFLGLVFIIEMTNESACRVVGWMVTSNIRGPRFKACHWQSLLLNEYRKGKN